ncbi:hypothetical protein A2U01_0116323, partial [Trifolium medium]|nr:hypothetical protein [Trifolium medium]
MSLHQVGESSTDLDSIRGIFAKGYDFKIPVWNRT